MAHLPGCDPNPFATTCNHIQYCLESPNEAVCTAYDNFCINNQGNALCAGINESVVCSIDSFLNLCNNFCLSNPLDSACFGGEALNVFFSVDDTFQVYFELSGFLIGLSAVYFGFNKVRGLLR